jgi:hemerythrin-like metal-binding protein
MPEKTKNVVTWQNSYSVSIKLVDEQHMELIRLTNKLFANCMAGQERSSNTFLDTVHEAVNYTGYHFSTEEKIMERIKYPEYSRHRNEHKDFVREVFRKVEDFKEGKVHTPINFVYFLRDWILHHVAVSDRKLGDYLIYLKRTGELQKMTLNVRKDDATNRMFIQ